MLIKHVLYYGLARGGPGIINFIALAIYTRLLTPSEFGIYTLVLAYVGLIHVLVFQSLLLTLSRFLPAADHSPHRVLSHCLGLFFIATTILIILGLLIFLCSPSHELGQLIIITVILACAQAWHEFNLRFCSSNLLPKQYGIIGLVKTIIAISLGSMLALQGLGSAAALIGLIAGCLVAWSTCNFRHFKNIRPSIPPKEDIKVYFNYGGPLTLTFLLTWFIGTSDRLFINFFIGTEAAGVYSAGYDLAQQILVLALSIINTAALPLAIKALEKKGIQEATEQLRLNGELIFTFSLCGAAFLIANASNLINLLIGEAFRFGAESIFTIIVITSAIASIKAFYFDTVFNLSKKPKYLISSTLIAAVISLLANYILIPTYGIKGAAFSSLIAITCACIVSSILGNRVFTLPKLTPLITKACFSSLIIFITCVTTSHINDSPTYRVIISLISSGFILLLMMLLFNTANLRKQLQLIIKNRY